MKVPAYGSEYEAERNGAPTITVHPPAKTNPCGFVWPDPPNPKRKPRKKAAAK